MKIFKKLVLTTAIAAACSSSYALEQLDDTILGDTTAQEGITITITPDAETGIQIDELYIHDNDGLAADDNTFSFNGEDVSLGGQAQAGAVLVKVLSIKGDDGSNIEVDVDTDAGDNNEAFINASVKMNGTTTIGFDKVQVVASGDTNTQYSGLNNTTMRKGANGAETSDILGKMSLSIADAKMNVQMGAQPQGAMVLMDAQLTGGLTIDKLEVIDADGHGSTQQDQRKGGLLVEKVVLTDTDSANMTLAQKIDIDSEKGLVIEMKSPTNGFYGYMSGVGFSDGNGAYGKGGNNKLGDVEIVGLKMGTSTISISGH